MSYPELWDAWERSDLPMPDAHLGHLRRRYGISL
jgi:hypothetical protein